MHNSFVIQQCPTRAQGYEFGLVAQGTAEVGTSAFTALAILVKFYATLA
jgi:hypothetical protein